MIVLCCVKWFVFLFICGNGVFFEGVFDLVYLVLKWSDMIKLFLSDCEKFFMDFVLDEVEKVVVCGEVFVGVVIVKDGVVLVNDGNCIFE